MRFILTLFSDSSLVFSHVLLLIPSMFNHSPDQLLCCIKFYCIVTCSVVWLICISFQVKPESVLLQIISCGICYSNPTWLIIVFELLLAFVILYSSWWYWLLSFPIVVWIRTTTANKPEQIVEYHHIFLA